MVKGQQRQSAAPPQPSENVSGLQRAASSTSLSSLTSSSNVATTAAVIAASASAKVVPMEVPPQPQTEESTAHAAFIEAFSTPTHLYRYLALRKSHSPIFLNRCLAYLHRSHRRVGCRPLTEAVSTLTGRPIEASTAAAATSAASAVCSSSSATQALEPEVTAPAPWDLPRNATLELTFSGFFDSCREKEWVTVSAELDLSVVHRCYNRRKSTRSSGHKQLTRLSLECNPQPRNQRWQQQQRVEAKSYTVMNKDLRDSQANRIIQSYLLLRISATEKRSYSKMYDSPPDSRKSHKKDNNEYPVQYCAVLPLFNHSRVAACADSGSTVSSPLQLCSGDYECRLECLGAEEPPELAEASSRLLQEWHSARFRHTSPETAEYDKWPVVRFRAQWTGVTGEVPVGDPPVAQTPQQSQQQQLRRPSLSQQQLLNAPDPSSTWLVAYGFFHHNRCHQWSEVLGLVCPWCDLDCRQPTGLLCHLRACHPRFRFCNDSDPPPSAARRQHQNQQLCIEVSINLDYNGGFEGDPANMFRPSRYDATPYPTRRLPFTHLLHWKGARCAPENQPELLATNPRPLVSGHTRQYFHTQTCVPLMPDEIDGDSEDETAPDWLRHKYTRNLEDFTDVNPGEKAVMTAWNLHVMSWESGPVTGQHQLPQLCQAFIDRCGRQLLKDNLRGNTLLHLANLTDYGLIKPELCYSLVQQLDNLVASSEPMELDES